MKLNKHLNKVLVLIAIIVISSLVLASCATPAPAKTTAPAPVAAEPKSGGILKVGIRTIPPSLDTFVAGLTATATYAIFKTFNQTLARWDGKNDREAVAAPLLAKSWEVSPDGLTYTFHLREGVKWQNVPPGNGREVTADDWAYHFNRLADPANKHQARTTLDMKSCEAVDKYTFKVTTNQKAPGFLAYVAGSTLAPTPKEVVEAPGGAEKNWVGTGPFILTEYVRDVKAVFKKNPNYWDTGKPYLDGVEIYFMPDPAARLAAFRSGTLDVLPSESKTNRDAIEKSVTGVQIQDGISMLEAGLLLNLKKAPFDNKQVRQALLYSIDYEGLIKAALDGGGMRTGYLAPWFGEWGAKQLADLPKRDVAKAKALLAEAGFPNGFKTTILQNTGNMEFAGNAVEPVVAMLKEVGIEATIVQADNPTFISKWRAGNYDMTIWTCFTGRPYDPDNSLRQQWASKGAGNVGGYNNAKVDELIKAQQDAFPDKEKRKPFVKEILTILEDEVPAVPLYIMTNYYIKQPWVKGMDGIADPQGAFGLQALPGTWMDKK
jgi:peptide/nickel transport system substrate-binding protein